MVNERLARSRQLDVNVHPVERDVVSPRIIVQRRTFRIEQFATRSVAMAAARRTARQPRDDIAPGRIALAPVFDALRRSRQDLAALSGNGYLDAPLKRAGEELRAAIGGMDVATQNILKVAEDIDEGSRALVATLVDDYKRGVAQDIQEQVSRIYEACNFQDLAGQRITKAIATLDIVERAIAQLLRAWSSAESGPSGATNENSLINGPRLDGDTGHADQNDIDRLFA
jgi:chemotaxis protein CheZ